MEGCLAEGCWTQLVTGVAQVMSARFDQVMTAGFQVIAADQVWMKAAGRGLVWGPGKTLELT